MLHSNLVRPRIVLSVHGCKLYHRDDDRKARGKCNGVIPFGGFSVLCGWMELGGSQVRGPFKKRGDFPLLPLFSGMVYWLRVDRVVKTIDVHQALSCDKRSNLYKVGIFL